MKTFTRLIVLASVCLCLVGCELSITTNGLVYKNPNFGGIGYASKSKTPDAENSTSFTTRGDATE